MGCYSGGTISRIKLQNFLTYDNLEVFPSTGLNLIIGLNGTGKSSIVCGICLGLAGKPQFTGRATQISDYIKHGCKIADIEIELVNKDSSKVIISRKIKQDNKSSWMLNGRTVQFNAVSDVVKQFNIQTDNLCQFLPQERVIEFSKMDKKQRLENLLQAIGDQNLYYEFNELKKLKKNVSTHDLDISELNEKLEMEKQKNDRLRVEVERANEKTQLESVVKLLEDRKKIIHYSELQSEHERLVHLKGRRKKEMKRFKKEKDDLDGVVKSMNSELEHYNQSIKSLDNDNRRSIKVVSLTNSKICELDQNIQEAKIEFANKIEEKNGQQKRIQELRQQIVGLQHSYEDLHKKANSTKGEENKFKQQHKDLLQVKSDILSRKKGIIFEINHLNTKIAEISKDITNLKNEDRKKMEVLMKIDKHTHDAAVWLNDNKDKFKNTIHPPIMISIKVNREGDEKYIENHIHHDDMIAFVCEDDDDLKLFMRIVRREKKLAVNAVLTPRKLLSEFKQKFSKETLRDMGFDCYLQDLFTAPDAVMRYLCDLHYVNLTPVGGQNAENFIQSLPSNFPFPVCYTSKSKYIVKTSKYGSRNKSITKTALRPPRLLVSSMDVTDRLKLDEEELKRCKLDLENYEEEYRSLGGEETRISVQIESLRKNLKDIDDRRRNLVNLSDSLSQKKTLLRNNESKIIDEEDEKRKTTNLISSFCETRIIHMNANYNEIKVLLETSQVKLKKCFFYSIMQKKLQKNQRLIREANERFEDAEKRYVEMKTIATKVYKEASLLFPECEKISEKFKDNENKEIQYVLKFKTLDDIDPEIQMKQAQVELTAGTNQSIIDEYHRRIKDIADIQKRIQKHEDGATNLQTEIEQKKERWLASLEGHITKINEKFNSYFKLLKCVGEIILDKSNDSNDFQKYGLKIMIKYRDNEPLAELSQDHHSGGECSVAAILFILSLQELTDVPFRCIDEINQGMDSVNERKVFELIASSACNVKCSQYFLLTPKLLTDLPYHENMKIHVIYNGPSLEVSWNLKEILERRSNCE